MKKTIVIFVVYIAVFLSVFPQGGIRNAITTKESVPESKTLRVDIEYITAVGNKLGVEIVYNKKVTDSWNGVTYTDCTKDELVAYVHLLEKEFIKYPAGYLKKSLVDTIVLGNDMAYKKQYRAGIPDPYKKVLYLSVNGSYSVAESGYLIHTMHHELVHCTDVALWGDMYYDWPEWATLNTKGFAYGSGGVTAYDDPETDYISPVHPKKGFINRYSMTGDEEDRAEMMAFWMSDAKRGDLKNLMLSDPIIKAKLALLLKTYEGFAGAVFKVDGK